MKLVGLAFLLFSQVSEDLPTSSFCADIRTLAAGAAEDDPFRSLRDRDFRPRLGRLHCVFTGAGGYSCFHNLARPDESRVSYADALLACLPGASRTTEREHFETYEVVRSGAFEARVRERGQDHGHGGRSIEVRIAARTDVALTDD